MWQYDINMKEFMPHVQFCIVVWSSDASNIAWLKQQDTSSTIAHPALLYCTVYVPMVIVYIIAFMEKLRR